MWIYNRDDKLNSLLYFTIRRWLYFDFFIARISIKTEKYLTNCNRAFWKPTSRDCITSDVKFDKIRTISLFFIFGNSIFSRIDEMVVTHLDGLRINDLRSSKCNWIIVVSIASNILFAASIFRINLSWTVFVTVDRTLSSNISSTYDLRAIVLNQERSKGIFFKGTNVIKLRNRLHDDFMCPQLAVTIGVIDCREALTERTILTNTIGGPMEFTLRMMGVWMDSSYEFLQRVLWTICCQSLQFNIGTSSFTSVLKH